MFGFLPNQQRKSWMMLCVQHLSKFLQPVLGLAGRWTFSLATVSNQNQICNQLGPLDTMILVLQLGS